MALPWHVPLETLPTIREKRDIVYQGSLLKHFCSVGFYDPPINDVQTGVMCDIGPYNKDIDIIHRLIGAGMTVARLVFNDMDPETCVNLVKCVRAAVYNYSIDMDQVYPLALLIDLRGPDILTGDLKSGANVEIVKHTVLRLTTDTAWQASGTSECLYFDFNNLKTLQCNDLIYIESLTKVKIKLQVTEVGNTSVDCNVLIGGLIGPNMVVRIVPSSKSCDKRKIKIEGDNDDALDSVESVKTLVSEHDEDVYTLQSITFALAAHVDGVLLSKTKSVHCIVKARKATQRSGKSLLYFICIDSLVAFENFDKLLIEADGIYLDRNVLGKCLPIENISIVTKMMMAKCNRAGKPCIVAATLNEEIPFMGATDIANLVHDGVDVIALNLYHNSIDPKFSKLLDTFKVAEKCLTAVRATCKYAEKTIWKPKMHAISQSSLYSVDDTTKAMCISALELAIRSQAAAIICLTNSGKAPKLLSQVKSLCPIVAVTRSCNTARQLQFWRGIRVLHYFEEMKTDISEEIDARILAGLDLCKNKRIVKAGDPYVVVMWTRPGMRHSNSARLLYASARGTIVQIYK